MLGKTEPRPDLALHHERFRATYQTQIHSGRVHLLIGPAGCGKTTVAAITILDLIDSKKVQRVLVATPFRVLSGLWALLLGRQNPILMDSMALRSLQQEINSHTEWPTGIYILSLSLIDRPEIENVFMHSRWDLIIIDDADGASIESLSAIQRIYRYSAPALLVVSQEDIRENADLVKDSILIDWRDTPNYLNPSKIVSSTTREYHRSQAEFELLRAVHGYAKELGYPKGMELLKAAASSSCSLQRILLRWADPAGSGPIADGVASILSVIENMRTDSKLECFKQLVEELIKSGNKCILIMSEYKSTLDYLMAALESEEYKVFTIRAQEDVKNQARTIGDFKTAGGAFIVHLYQLQGMYFDFIDVVIHYDLPLLPQSFHLRETWYTPSFLHKNFKVYFLKDKKRAFPFERMLLQMACTQSYPIVEGKPYMEDLYNRAITGTESCDSKD